MLAVWGVHGGLEGGPSGHAMRSIRVARLATLAAAVVAAFALGAGEAAAATVQSISGPPRLTNATGADFKFTITPSASPTKKLRVNCQLDVDLPGPCDSTTAQHYALLGDGPHLLTVTAADDDEPSSKAYPWTVDTTPPVTSLDAPAAAAARTRGIAFTFHSEPGARFTCTLDRVSRPCSSPAPYSGLADGPHLFSVTATDAAGNSDRSPPAWAWTVRLNRPPLPSFVVDPSPPRVGETARLTATSADADSPIAAQRWAVSGRGVRLAQPRPLARTASVRFPRVGTYVVTLTTTDTFGASATVTRRIRVRQLPAPPGSWQVQDSELVGPDGALLQALRIRADPGSKVEVRCRGRRCAIRSRYRAAVGRRGVLRVRRFERYFPAGAVIEVRVWDARHLTKLVRIGIRAGLAPRVRYGCEARGRKAVRCSS